ncbi:hypothetical protein [Streptomyces sp. NPDC050485]|uniref:hypothetical protein n=1 Tax=Streptomyces sp. NPDC050485 TaxID=3365617 RepID=UPI0037A21120
MTTKNTTAKTSDAQEAAEEKILNVPSANILEPMESIVLSHHLRIEGADFVPGSKVRVPSDYARRLRRQGYVARS